MGAPPQTLNYADESLTYADESLTYAGESLTTAFRPAGRLQNGSTVASPFVYPLFVYLLFAYPLCGAGKLDVCRTQLRTSLLGAVTRAMAKQGVTDPTKLTYDKSIDYIRPTTGGVVGVRPIDWQNRPTFQQVVDFRGHRAR